MASSTGYIHPNGITRKTKATAASAVTIGPAIVIVVSYLLSQLPHPVPDAVMQAVNVLIEATVVLVSAFLTAPAATDQIAVDPHPAIVAAPTPVVPPAPVRAPVTPAPVLVPIAPVVVVPPPV